MLGRCTAVTVDTAGSSDGRLRFICLMALRQVLPPTHMKVFWYWKIYYLCIKIAFYARV